MSTKASPLNAQIMRSFQQGDSVAATVVLRAFNDLWKRSGGSVDQVAATAEVVTTQGGLIAAGNEATQGATAAANAAQAAADAAAGGSARSGSASNTSLNLTGTDWVNGPTVNLSTVSAGDLTLTGSGPQQDADVTLSANRDFSGEYRIVEIVGMTEDTVHTGTFTASPSGVEGGAFIYPDNSTMGFSQARASTGSVSYRLDVRRIDGPNLLDLGVYLYARRS